MNVKSHATVSYRYDMGNKNVKSVAVSNVVHTEVRDVRLYVKKYSDLEYFLPGDVINYTLVISNPGNYFAKNITIKDKLDKANYIKDSFAYDFLNSKKHEVVYKFVEDELLITIEMLEANAVCIINYQVRTIETFENFEEIRHSVKVSSNEINEFSYEESKTLKQKYAKILCSKKTDEFTYLNNDLTYYITLKNIGNCNAFDVELVDQLPKTFKLSDKKNAITINGEEASVYTIDPNTNLLKVLIDTVPAGDSEILVCITGKIVN